MAMSVPAPMAKPIEKPVEARPEPVKTPPKPAEQKLDEAAAVPDIPYEQMTVAQLQAAILQKMASNGPVTEQMRRSVAENVWQNSLINWVKSFR